MGKKIFFLHFLVAIAFADTKIVGGADVPFGSKFSRPVVALLTEYKNELLVSCTGTLISSQVVITAAHCLNHIISDQVFVSNGENPLSNNEKIKVTHLIYYSPQFWNNFETGDDIAILVLEKKFSMFDILKIGRPDYLKLGMSVTQLGYGFQSFSPSRSDMQYPSYGKLQILDGKSKIVEINKQKIATESPSGYGIAGGDSGGPVVIQNDSMLYLIGVTSTGGQSYNDDGSTTPGAGYIFPYYFINWINSALPSGLQLNVTFEVKDQFPESNIKVVPVRDFPSYNKNLCNRHRTGWDIDKDQSCWPSTRESCEFFERNDVPGAVYWNENEKRCATVLRSGL